MLGVYIYLILVTDFIFGAKKKILSTLTVFLFRSDILAIFCRSFYISHIVSDACNDEMCKSLQQFTSYLEGVPSETDFISRNELYLPL